AAFGGPAQRSQRGVSIAWRHLGFWQLQGLQRPAQTLVSQSPGGMWAFGRRRLVGNAGGILAFGSIVHKSVIYVYVFVGKAGGILAFGSAAAAAPDGDVRGGERWGRVGFWRRVSGG